MKTIDSNKSLETLKKFYSFSKTKPDTIAIVDRGGTRKTNYKDFIKTINSYAYRLKTHKIGKGDVVSICLDGCMEHFAMRFACMFVGAIFISVNPDHPNERVETICKLTKVKFVVDKDTLKDITVKEYPTQIDESLDDSDLCYIISTSGTTSSPKLVLHDRSYFQLIDVLVDEFYPNSYQVIHAAMSDMMFVMSMIDMTFFLTGDTVHIIDFTTKTDIVKLNEYFIVHHINWTFILPSLLAALNPFPNLKVAFVAGETTSADLSKIDADVYNYYGASEACGISYAKIEGKTSSLGLSLPSSKLYLQGENGNIISKTAPNKKGEICISAPWVMRSYIGDKSATRKTISFSQADRYRTYHTKDIGYYNNQGKLILCGRIDSTQKIRGKRVDLAGLEYQIAQIEGIDKCAVITKDIGQEKVIYAFYTTYDKTQIDESYLKRELAKRMPEYMIPSFFIYLDKLKRNSRGKIDRHYLETQINKAGHVQQTLSDTQRRIVEVVNNIVHIDGVSIQDNLLSVGFSSLTLMQLQVKLKEEFRIQISRDDLFELKTLKNIADAIDKGLLKEKEYNYNVYTKPIALNEAQVNIYLDEAVKNTSTAYNNPIRIDVSAYSKDDISKAINFLILKHPILCSRIKESDSGPSLIFDVDISIGLVKDKKEFIRPFKLNKSLSRFGLMQQKNKLYLLADFHHIICDGTSISLLMHEFTCLLEGKDISTSFDGGLFSYLEYERDIKNTDTYKDAKTFFDNLLCEADRIEELVESAEDSYENKLYFNIDLKQDKLDLFCKAFHITKTQYLSSAFAFTLSRFCGSDNPFLCLIEDGRSHIDLSNSIGMYVKTLPIVFDCKDKEIKDYLKESSKIQKKAQDYDFYPFRMLASEYNISPSITFQYSHNLRKYDSNFTFKELKHDMVGDLSVNVADTDKGMKLIIEHSHKYSDALCESIAYSFIEMLKGMLTEEKLSDISFTSKEDIQTQELLNNTETPLKYDDILQALQTTLTKYPNNTLVTYEKTSYTYTQGISIATSIADRLETAGIKPQDNVAILVPRSQYYLLCALGVLICGAAYIPIDDTYPDERISFMLKDTASKVVLVTVETKQRAQDILASINSSATPIEVDDIKADTNTKPFSYHKTHLQGTACILYTSGTTGKPKGSLITRQAILNVSEWYVKYTHMTKGDIYSLYTAFTFDMHVLGLYPHLICAASLDIVPQEIRLDLKNLDKHFTSVHTTHTLMTTHVGKMFVEQNINLTIKYLFVIGEKLGEFLSPKNIGMYESYGPTESLALVSAIRVNERISSNSVGKVFSNIKAYILDNNLQRVPTGAVGQLFLSGYQLAKGYLNQPDLTSQVFLDNPFDGNRQGYEKMYATGDMVRYLPDGSLGFIGRKDTQVKIRGNRVELGEVESSIRELDSISDVTVQAICANSTKELCAYVVSDIGDEKELYSLVTQHISNTKPSYMVPAFVMFLDAIPLNTNGKVNKKALPNPDISKMKAEYIPAKDDTQQKIIDAFEEVLQVTHIGIDDDFIRLGGDSLKAIKIASMLTDFGISASDLLKYKTAANISKSLPESGSYTTKDNKEIIDKTYQLYNQEIKQCKRRGYIRVPLSEPQQNIYVDCLANSVTKAYTNTIEIVVSALLSEKDILDSLYRLRNSYPIFASRIVNIDNDYYLSCDAGLVWLGIFDEDKKVEDLFKDEIDFNKALVRFVLIKQDNKNLLICNIHHIITDASSGPIIKDALHAAVNNTLPKDIDYGFVKDSAYCQCIKDSRTFKESKHFYEDILKDTLGTTQLLSDNFSIDKDSKDKGHYFYQKALLNLDDIDLLSKRFSATSGAIIASAFAYTLSCFSAEDKVVFSSLDASRTKLCLESSIGCFLRTNTLAIDCKEKPIKDYIGQVSKIFIEAMDKNSYPYQKLARKHSLTNSICLNYTPGVLLGAKDKTPTQSLDNFKNNIYTTYTTNDLDFGVYEYGKDLIFRPKYSNKFTPKLMKRFCDAMSYVLYAFKTEENLSDIYFTTPEDIQTQDLLNKTETPLKYDDILQALQVTLSKYPDNILVTYENTSYTYQDGISIAAQIANRLETAGIKAQDNVAILVPRSEYYLLCALGVLICGAAYVPIDDTYPDERISFMLKDTASSAVLVTEDTKQRVQDILTSINISAMLIEVEDIKPNTNSKSFNYHKPKLQDTACILYTSGTTGKPKGSLITRGAINNFGIWFYKISNLGKDDIYGLYASISFDVALEMFSLLFVGATLSVIPYRVRMDTDKLLDYIKIQNITVTELPVSIAKLLRDSSIPKCLHTIHTGGEAVGVLKLSSNICLLDAYGPTEACVASTWIDVAKKTHPSSIGYALFNTKAYILDNSLRRLPQGASGQLYLSGYQLAKGYLNQPGLTKQVFLDNPFDGDTPGYEKMYATGDMVRYLPDGTLGFIGRKDTQVKIRGNRVELGEIESSIREIDEIDDVTIQAISANNTKELCVYCVSSIQDEKELYSLITQHITDTKPSYMVPAFVIKLDAIPLTTNGKVDKRALPEPDISTLKAEYIPAKDDTQQKIIDAFEEVLQVAHIGIDDDFIRLGGDSLKAMQVSSRLLSLGISSYEIVQYKTPYRLSLYINKNQDKGDSKLEQVIIKTKQKSNQIIKSAVEGKIVEIPLSEPQLNIYTDCMSHGLKKAYTTTLEFELDKSFDEDRVCEMLEVLYEKYPIFSSRIKHESDIDIYLCCDSFVNWCGFFDREQDKKIINVMLNQSFDLEESLIWFFGVSSFNSKTLVCVAHHLIYDYISIPIIKDVISKAIKGEFESSIDYGFIYDSTFCCCIKNSPLANRSKEFYFDMLKDVGGSTKFIDKALNPKFSQGESGKEFFEILDISKDELSQFAVQKSSTQGSILLAAFAYALSLFSKDKAKVVFSSLDAGRGHLNLHNCIGCFLRTNTIAIDTSQKMIDEYIAKVTEVFLKSMELNFYPYQKLVSNFGIDTNIIFNYNPDTLLTVNEFSNNQDNNAPKIGEVYKTYATNELDFGVYEHKDNIVIRPKFSDKYLVCFMKKFCHTYNKVLNVMLKCTTLEEIKEEIA